MTTNNKNPNGNFKVSASFLPIIAMLTIMLSSMPTLVVADTVQLADCPNENVIGTYINNGKKCVRERMEISRDIVDATCKSGWELMTPSKKKDKSVGKAFCKVIDSDKTEFKKDDTFPVCPIDYKRYGRQCHSPCPKGYNGKRGICIQLKDTLPQHSMSCSDPKMHHIGAFCCEDDQCGDLVQKRHEDRIKNMQQKYKQQKHPSIQKRDGVTPTKTIPPPPPSTMRECNLPDVPGRFYHNSMTGRCDRSRISEPRIWTKLPRDNRNKQIGSCDEGTETKVLGGCQANCPPYYKAQKGMCQLPPCSIPFGNGTKDQNEKGNGQVKNRGIVLCPEGKYYLAAKAL